MFLQLAAYCIMLEEQGYKVEQAAIIIVNDSGYNEKFISREDLEEYITVFVQIVEVFHLWYEINLKNGWGIYLSKEYSYVGAILSDPHSGAFDAKQWYKELEEGFLTDIKKLSILDFLIITGDYFDTKISANSDHAKYALKF